MSCERFTWLTLLYIAIVSFHQNAVIDARTRTAKIIPFPKIDREPPALSVVNSTEGRLQTNNSSGSLSEMDLKKTLILIKLVNLTNNNSTSGDSSTKSSSNASNTTGAGINGADPRLPRIFNVFDVQCGKGEIYHPSSGSCVPSQSDISDYD